MQVTYNVTTGQVSFTFDAATDKDAFARIAAIRETFHETQCGLCKGNNIIPMKRTVTQGKKVFEYFEYRCLNPKCRGILAMGVHQEGGTLFPIRKLDKDGKPDRENGTFGDHRGWHVYRGEPKANS